MSKIVYLGANYAAYHLLDKSLQDESIFIDSIWHSELRGSELLDKRKYFDRIKDSTTHADIIIDTNLVERLMSDYNLPLLFSRMGFKFRLKYFSDLKKFSFYLDIIKCCISFLSKHKPDVVYFAYEPHSLPVYIFKQTAISLGVKCITMTQSAFTWRLHAESKGLVCKRGELTKEGKDNALKFIEEKLADYDIAKPFYERISSSIKFQNWRRINIIKSINTVQGKFLKRSYKNLVEDRSSFGDDYLVFFLHYQPESTTLPDGRLFVSQTEAIAILSKIAERLDMNLVVREHPASFREYNRIWRPTDFYDHIKTISSKVIFDDTARCPYELIKKSRAVSSITGSVILESLLLGKPALAFGKHTLANRNIQGLVDYTNWTSFQFEVRRCLQIDRWVISESIKSCLMDIYADSYGSEEYPGNNNMNLDLLRLSRNLAFKEVLDRN